MKLLWTKPIIANGPNSKRWILENQMKPNVRFDSKAATKLTKVPEKMLLTICIDF